MAAQLLLGVGGKAGPDGSFRGPHNTELAGDSRATGRLSLSSLLRDRTALLDRVRDSERLPSLWLQLTAVMAYCAGAYGAVFGMWHGPRLAFYVAVKFPFVLIATAGLTMMFNWVVAVVAGLSLRFMQVAVLTFLTLAIAERDPGDCSLPSPAPGRARAHAGRANRAYPRPPAHGVRGTAGFVGSRVSWEGACASGRRST